jgi:hypothetical protein
MPLACRSAAMRTRFGPAIVPDDTAHAPLALRLLLRGMGQMPVEVVRRPSNAARGLARITRDETYGVLHGQSVSSASS